MRWFRWVGSPTHLCFSVPDSGSLIKANFALALDREAMAVPVNITRKTSHGHNQLLKQGAYLVTELEEVLELLQPKISRIGTPTATKSRPELSDAAKTVLDLLDTTLRHIDILVLESGLTPMELSDILLHLELQGCALQLPGTRFVRGQQTSKRPSGHKETA